MDWERRSCSSDGMVRARMPVGWESGHGQDGDGCDCLTAMDNRVQSLHSATQHLWGLCDIGYIP
jgi:hypothetical protein